MFVTLSPAGLFQFAYRFLSFCSFVSVVLCVWKGSGKKVELKVGEIGSGDPPQAILSRSGVKVGGEGRFRKCLRFSNLMEEKYG